MLTSIPVGAKVICTDGPKGKTTAVIVDRESKKITHIGVVEKSLLHGEERLVPIDRVVKTTRDEIHLNCSSQELQQMAPFTRTHYLEIDHGESGYAYSYPYMTPYPEMAISPTPNYVTVQDQLVPEGEVAIQRDMRVEALDGPLGKVGELVIDESGKVSHFLLMKGHHWGKKEIAIAISEIQRGDEDTIYLKIDKARVEQLPSLPLNRNWDEVLATDLELVVWTFTGKDGAETALEQVRELSKKYAIEIFNATVIEKDASGKIQIHEKKEIASGRRVGLGLVLGGLAGLVVGPAALVAGAVAGAALGKRSADKTEVGFSEEKLRKLNDSLAPGGSALALIVEHRWFNTLQVETAESGGQLIHERLSDVSYDDLAGKLQGGEENI